VRAFNFVSVAVSALLLCSLAVRAADLPVVRVGSVKGGTFDWELETIRRLGLAEKHGFRLEPVNFASNPGVLIAMQGDAVDMVVTDWLWVSNQRARGKQIVAVPYSSAIGSVLTGKGSAIHGIEDLRGKKLGISGGPEDKTWLLLQAASLRKNGQNLRDSVDAVFGAPPLITQKLEQGELDGAIVFWHFAAKLSAKGYPTLTDGESLMRSLGLNEPVPLLVYAFKSSFAEEQTARVRAFLDASYEAKTVLLTTDGAWQPLREAMGNPDEATLRAMIAAWRAGVPRHWNAEDKRNAETLFVALHSIGGRQLVESEHLDPGTFWAPFSR